VVAVIGLAGTIVSTAGQYAGSPAYLGLGAGGAERLASYPGSLWIPAAGAGPHARGQRSQMTDAGAVPHR
jgi:hypothetical protein